MATCIVPNRVDTLLPLNVPLARPDVFGVDCIGEDVGAVVALLEDDVLGVADSGDVDDVAAAETVWVEVAGLFVTGAK